MRSFTVVLSRFETLFRPFAVVFGRVRGQLRSFAVVPSDGPLLNRADFNKVYGPVLISLFQSQDQRQELFHKLLGIYIGAKLAIIGVTP